MQATRSATRSGALGVLRTLGVSSAAAAAAAGAAVMLPTAAMAAAMVATFGIIVLLVLRLAIARRGGAPRSPVHAPAPAGTERIPHFWATGRAAPRDASLVRASRWAYIGGILLLGIQLLRPAFGFTASDFLFLAATAGAGMVALRQRNGLAGAGYLPGLMVAGSLLFAVASLASTVGAPSPAASLVQLAKFAFIIFGWFWAGTILLVEPRHVRVAAAAWIATVAINGAAALVQLSLGDVIPGGTVEWGRMAGLTDHFNDLGGSAGIALAPSLAVAAGARGVWRALAWGMVVLVGAALFLSGSVAGMITGMVGLAVYFALGGFRLGRRTALAGIALTVLAIVALTVLPALGAQTPLSRLDVAAGAGGTLSSRIETFQQAWWSISLDPIIGTGLAQGPTRTGYDVHNLLLGIWYQAGIVGALGLLLVLVGTTQVAVAAVATAPNAAIRRLSIGLLGAFFGFLTLGLAQPLLLQRYAWVPAALLLALYAQTRDHPGEAALRAPG